MAENQIRIKSQDINIEDRKKIRVTGVENVESFNDNTIVLKTINGGLIIKGEELNINNLNVEDGNLNIIGKINGVNYSARDISSKGILEKLFK